MWGLAVFKDKRNRQWPRLQGPGERSENKQIIRVRYFYVCMCGPKGDGKQWRQFNPRKQFDLRF